MHFLHGWACIGSARAFARGDNEEAYSASLAEPRSVAINSILVAHRGFNNVLRTYETRRIPSGIFQATMRVTLEQ